MPCMKNNKKSVRMKTRKGDLMDAKAHKKGSGMLPKAFKTVVKGGLTAMDAAAKAEKKVRNLGKNFKGAYGGKK